MRLAVTLIAALSISACMSFPWKHLKPGTIDGFERSYQTQAPRSEVYDLALQWASLNYKVTQQPIKYQSKDKGRFIAQASWTDASGKNLIYYDLTLDAKQSGYRVKVANITGQWQGDKESVRNGIDGQMADLRDYIRNN